MDNRIDPKVIYPELSYQIVSCLFEVYRSLGANRRERFYQNALRREFNNRKLKFREQVYIPVAYKNHKIGRNYLDFLIEDKVVLELKTGSYFSKSHIEQVLSYLKSTNLKLGIIANFTRDGVKFYRVVNLR